MKYDIKKTHQDEIMVIAPKESESVSLDFNGFKRNGEFIDLRMQINYCEDDKLYYALMYARDENGLFRDLKLQVSFERLDLAKSVEDNLGLFVKQ